LKQKQSFILKLLVWSLVLTLVITGCSNSGDNAATNKGSSNGGNTDKAKKITLEYWTTNAGDQKVYTEIVDSYTKVAPNVEVKVTYLGTTGIDEKVNVALAANKFPDIYGDSSQRMVPLVVKDVLQPLDEYITPEYNLDDYYKGMRDLSTVNGKLYMFPTGNSTQVLMVNKALFKLAGVENLLPNEETRAWDRDTFEKAVKAIGALDGVHGLGLGAVQTDHDKYTDGYIYGNGDEYMNEDYTEFTYNSPQNVETFEWLINLVNSDAAVPGASGNSVTNILELAKQGKVGVMQYYGSKDVAKVQQDIKDGKLDIPFDIMFARFPTKDGHPSKLLAYSTAIGVKRQEDKQRMDEAAKFAMWLTSGKIEELNQLEYVVSGAIPARASLKSYVADPEQQKLMEMSDNVVRNLFMIPTFQENRKLWFNQFQPAYAGQISAQEAMDNFVKNATQLLADYNAKKK
jgi:multiple sugar transport system substrate-binding protein